MTLIVVARFASLQEAEIAAGALASGGLHPTVMDGSFGSVVWTDQFALQGFRLAVPEFEAVDARGYFASLPPVRTRRRTPERPSNYAWRGLAIVLAIGLSPTFGWLAVAGLRRGRPGRMLETAIGAIGVLAFLATAFGLFIVSGRLSLIAWLLVAVPVAAVLMKRLDRSNRLDADDPPS